jgi:hypothetical protein
MYNRPICGRSTGAYTNLGDLQGDLMGVKSHPTKKKVGGQKGPGKSKGLLLHFVYPPLDLVFKIVWKEEVTA